MLKGKGEWWLKLETQNHEGHTNQMNYNKVILKGLLIGQNKDKRCN